MSDIIEDEEFIYRNDSSSQIEIIGLSTLNLGEKIVFPGSYQEKTVKLIYDYAFYYNPQIKEIEIQDGVVSIGHYAFSNCKTLEKVLIADSVEYIGQF